MLSTVVVTFAKVSPDGYVEVYGLRMTRKHRCRLQSPKRANLSPTGLCNVLASNPLTGNV